MSRNKYSSPEFKKLQADWYARIKEEGFNDAEQGPYLKEWDSFYFQARHHPQSFSSHHDYYYWAEQFLNSFDFSTDTEKDIWALHASGLGYREIARDIESTQAHSPHCTKDRCDIFCLIKTGGLFIVNKDKVGKIIARLRTIMIKSLNKADRDE